MTDYRTRLRALAADLERFDLWGGTRSQSDAEDLRSLLSEADRLRALLEEAGATLGYYAMPQIYVERKTLAPAVMYERGDIARSLLTKLKGEGQ